MKFAYDGQQQRDLDDRRQQPHDDQPL